MITPLSASYAGLTGMQQSRAVPTNMCLHFGHRCLVAPHHVIAQQQPSEFVPSSSRINRRQILVLFRHFRTKTDYVTWFPTYVFVPKLIMLHGFLQPKCPHPPPLTPSFPAKFGFQAVHKTPEGISLSYWAIQRSWFTRVNALCNLSRKKSREVAAHFRADF